MYTIDDFNQLNPDLAAEELFKCCGSGNWVNKVMERFPFVDKQQLFDIVLEGWYGDCNEDDYLEAFSHHPRIGDIESLKEKFASTRDWAGDEQAGVNIAEEKTIVELARLNEVYYTKFGFIFIVCATGKSAQEMLQLLKARIGHNKKEEIAVAKGEQHKITLIRLNKLMDLKNNKWNERSQITTHVLDTSLGRPGKGITIKLLSDSGETIAVGVTDSDGRISDLLPSGRILATGDYTMHFETKDYFGKSGVTGFYPVVDIHFTVIDDSHYHVPLLINPYGYSTYRGS